MVYLMGKVKLSGVGVEAAPFPVHWLEELHSVPPMMLVSMEKDVRGVAEMKRIASYLRERAVPVAEYTTQ